MSAWFAAYPHLGGGRGTYQRLLRTLRRHGHCHVPVLPGRDERFGERPLRSFTSLADDLWRQLHGELEDGHAAGDLVLFGFSMGALLATEMAARLEQRGEGPRGLVVAACPPPHLLPVGSLADLPDDEFTAALAAQGVMPARLLDEPELVAMLLPLWRADCEVVASHPRRPVILRCPVLAFGGAEDATVPTADLAVWERVGGPGSAVTVIPGGHGAVLEREDLLLEALRYQAAENNRARTPW